MQALNVERADHQLLGAAGGGAKRFPTLPKGRFERPELADGDSEAVVHAYDFRIDDPAAATNGQPGPMRPARRKNLHLVRDARHRRDAVQV